jgi:hypothetical protein
LTRTIFFVHVLCMYELVYVLEDHFHILVIYWMDLWKINDDDDDDRTSKTMFERKEHI